MAKSLIDRLLGKSDTSTKKGNSNKKSTSVKNKSRNNKKKGEEDDKSEDQSDEEDLKALVGLIEKVIEAREQAKAEDIDDEEDIEDEDVEDIEDEEEYIEDEEDIEEIEEIKKEDTTVAKIFNKGWFNKETGEIDFNAIGDENVRKAFKLVLKTQKSISDNKSLIDNEIKAQLKDNYQLNVSESTFNKLFDRSKISVGSDGKVSGIKEAFEALAKEEPNVFKAVKGGAKGGVKGGEQKVNSPLSEGFNPVRGANNGGNYVPSYEECVSILSGK